MNKGEMLYEGKAKRVYLCDNKNELIIEYKDQLTAFNAEKKAQMSGKGRLNNLISARIFEQLNQNGVPTHFIEKIDEIHCRVKKVKIIPIEVVVRNITTGSLCKRLGVAEGIKLPYPLLELYYKDDALGDPIICQDHALLFGWASEEELAAIRTLSFNVNDLMKEFFVKRGIVLVDFKLEFGKTVDGILVVADEISPDTCRFWDSASGDRLDKDRFRKDLGNVLGAYEEIWRRVQ